MAPAFSHQSSIMDNNALTFQPLYRNMRREHEIKDKEYLPKY
ncbi:uncharacterized protein G2W53_028817 [Senna tora]|uniref:Uncharacterized protein n=1 Tax=Senna tora TaxID=362788 RepID=A0A834WB38_9FABA|nr:uncharacterized protein G2W53_028817 [Senna tora]